MFSFLPPALNPMRSFHGKKSPKEAHPAGVPIKWLENTETSLQAESDAGMHFVDGRIVFRLTEADADIAAGRIHRFRSVDEMLASLKRPLR